MLRPVLDQIAKLWARVDMMPVVRRGFVTTVSPLTVTLDGDIDTLGNPIATPAQFGGTVGVGDRVVCVEQHRRLIVIDASADTGWVPLTYTSGFTAGQARQLEYRVKDGVFYLRGGATGTFLNATYTTVTDEPLPEGLRPSNVFRAGAAAQAGRGALVEVNTTGHILFCHSNATNPAWIACGVARPLD